MTQLNGPQWTNFGSGGIPYNSTSDIRIMAGHTERFGDRESHEMVGSVRKEGGSFVGNLSVWHTSLGVDGNESRSTPWEQSSDMTTPPLRTMPVAKFAVDQAMGEHRAKALGRIQQTASLHRQSDGERAHNRGNFFDGEERRG